MATRNVQKLVDNPNSVVRAALDSRPGPDTAFAPRESQPLRVVRSPPRSTSHPDRRSSHWFAFAIVSVRTICRMNALSVWGVIPSTRTRRVARSMTNTESNVTRPRHVQTSLVKKSAPAIAEPCLQKRLPRRRALPRRRQTVGLQDARDRRSADLVPEILQGALKPRVAHVEFSSPHAR